jgi:hypothetical protein
MLHLISNTHTHTVGLLWTRNRPVAETKYNTHKIQISMPPAGLETAIPASEQPQTYVLDNIATEMQYQKRNSQKLKV